MDAANSTVSRGKVSEPDNVTISQFPSKDSDQCDAYPQIQLHPQYISSTLQANKVMKFHLGGSVSDPLNLQGGAAKKISDDRSCGQLPTLLSTQPPSLPQCFSDPLNIEGRSKKFPIAKKGSGTCHDHA